MACKVEQPTCVIEAVSCWYVTNPRTCGKRDEVMSEIVSCFTKVIDTAGSLIE